MSPAGENRKFGIVRGIWSVSLCSAENIVISDNGPIGEHKFWHHSVKIPDTIDFFGGGWSTIHYLNLLSKGSPTKKFPAKTLIAMSNIYSGKKRCFTPPSKYNINQESLAMKIICDKIDNGRRIVHIKYDRPVKQAELSATESNMPEIRYNLEPLTRNKSRRASKAAHSRKNHKTAVIFISHMVNDEMKFRYSRIKEGCDKLGYDAFWAMDLSSSQCGDLPSDIQRFDFSFDRFKEKFPNMCFFYERRFNMTPCVPHLFHLDTEQKYDYIWVVEYDVWFHGDWADFLGRYDDSNADLVSCDDFFAEYGETPNRYFFQYIIGPLRKELDRRGFLCGGLMCCARLSSRLILDLWKFHENLRSTCNFFEWTWPTVARLNRRKHVTFESPYFRPFPILTEDFDFRNGYMFHPVKENISCRSIFTNIVHNGDGDHRSCAMFVQIDPDDDKNLSTRFETSLRSFMKFYENSGIDVFVLTLGKDTYADLGLKNVNYVDCSAKYRKIERTIKNHTKMSPHYLKYAIPLLDFFYDYENVLYLDSDILFMSDELPQLFDVPDDGNEIIGVDEKGLGDITHFRYDWLNLPHDYVNTGMMLFKPKNIPMETAQDRFRKCCGLTTDPFIFTRASKDTEETFCIFDQTPINMTYKIKSISDYRFNCYESQTVSQLVPDGRICIRHYIGCQKSWIPAEFKTLMETDR